MVIKMKKVLIILLFCLMLTGCGSKESSMIKSGNITCNQKDTILKYDNAILVDVRSVLEYNSGHLDNAINIPLDNVVEDIKTLDNVNLDTPIIVYCKSGARSSQAFEKLKSEGYKNIYNLGAMSSCN